MKRISKHDIDNAFMAPGVPLSDQVHGIYRMFPPELLLWGVTLSKSSLCENFTHNFRHLYLNQKVHLGHGSWYHRVEQLLGCRMHLLNLV